jgi:hypothetical protein
MEDHFNQTVNATAEDPFFGDVSMYLKAIVLFLVILVTIIGKSQAKHAVRKENSMINISKL